ncbi:hypothetical protein GGX14DRAFT_639995 [Mycena pura]|uniref:Pentatricopeptide repeat-containing protein n=1 Tax=Mycena pura TaxID=153505 RepID=A0AAD6YPI3_9AGAR|nr:hypothetical protein GGX14DRAFT_639995 [Mycena pura]
MELVSSETFPGRANIFLSVVAAYAIEDSFQAALKAYIDADISVHRYATEDFVRILSYDPALQNKVKMFVERLELAKAVSRPRSLSKHIHNLSKQPASPILEDLYNSILKAVSGPDAYIAADPQNITSTTSVAVTELIWGSFLAAFLRRERNDLAARLWKDVTRLGIQPGILTWNMVMNVYSDRGSVKEVMGAWSTMSSQGVKPDGITYRALLSCLFAANKVTDALRWFRTFETDVKPSSTAEQTLAVYNAMLYGLLPLGREHAKVAFSILQNMAKEGPKPDLVSHNTVISYHGRRGDFKAMATVINQMSAAGITGDVFTFSTILSALLKAGRTDAPDMVLSIMRKQGVQASVATYTAIINSQTRERTVEHLQAAMRLLDAMEKSQDVTPNEITYTSILAALYRGNWLSADQRESYKQDIVARMKKRKIKFKAGGYNILIKACLTSGEPTGLDDALAFYRDMARNNVPPVDDTWYVLLAGLMQCGEWQIAREVVDEMFSSGAQPGNNVLRLVSKIREKAKER